MAQRQAHYPIERRQGEIERLHAQAAALAFDAGVMLDRIGVGPGWRCLDLACGPGGILAQLGERVGPAGSVIGLDMDPVLLAEARRGTAGAGPVRLVRGDAYAPGLRRESFDLVHVRFLASTAGRGDALLAEAVALARPGGVVAFEEPDTETLRCYPEHPAWTRLRRILQEVFVRTGGDTRFGQSLYARLRRAGLRDVQYRPFLVGVRSGDPWMDFLPATAESLRGTLLREGLIGEAELDRALAKCRAHLADPDTTFTSFSVVQVWGRTPAG